VKAIRDLQTKSQDLQKKIDLLLHEKAMQTKKELVSKIQAVNGKNLLITEVSLEPASLKDICFQLKAEHASFGAVFISMNEDKPMITCCFSDDAISNWNAHAGNLVKEWSKEIKGGGGGQAAFATAGGTDASGLQRVLELAKAKWSN
jgi:alanyl-tRNA synthetase